MQNRSKMGQDLPPQRKGLFYLGIAFIIMGAVVFLSVFFAVQPVPTDATSGVPPVQNNTVKIVSSLAFMVLGALVVRFASVGVKRTDGNLVPQPSKQEPEPWKRIAGGVTTGIPDTAWLDEALLDEDGNALPANEQLRLLDEMRADHQISEEEFQARRSSLLG